MHDQSKENDQPLTPEEQYPGLWEDAKRNQHMFGLMVERQQLMDRAAEMILAPETNSDTARQVFIIATERRQSIERKIEYERVYTRLLAENPHQRQ
jgi:hypothetical protein